MKHFRNLAVVAATFLLLVGVLAVLENHTAVAQEGIPPGRTPGVDVKVTNIPLPVSGTVQVCQPRTFRSSSTPDYSGRGNTCTSR